VLCGMAIIEPLPPAAVTTASVPDRSAKARTTYTNLRDAAAVAPSASVTRVRDNA
jgi:hypothetical protein